MKKVSSVTPHTSLHIGQLPHQLPKQLLRQLSSLGRAAVPVGRHLPRASLIFSQALARTPDNLGEGLMCSCTAWSRSGGFRFEGFRFSLTSFQGSAGMLYQF